MERTLEPSALRQFKELAECDISVGGAGLAGHAIAAGLVDEYQLLFAPAIVGGGTRCLPNDVRADLELLETRRFTSGFVFLRYRAR